MGEKSLIPSHDQWELLKATDLCKQYMAGGMPTEFIGDEELQQKLGELKDERFRLRFRSATESIENPVRFRTIRRDIARILTTLRARAGQA